MARSIMISHEDIKARCNMLLGSMLASNDDLASKWWNTPNKHWNNQNPENIFTDNPWEVYEYLLQHADSGGW